MSGRQDKKIRRVVKRRLGELQAGNAETLLLQLSVIKGPWWLPRFIYAAVIKHIALALTSDKLP